MSNVEAGSFGSPLQHCGGAPGGARFLTGASPESARSRCGSMANTLKRIKKSALGWLNYYSIADMKSNIGDINGWLYRRIRICIWKQWKRPRTRKRKLLGLGLPEWAACEGANSRKSYWRMSNVGVVKRVLIKERLIHWGFFDLSSAYQSMHVNC